MPSRLLPFVRASGLHIGAPAASAALQHDLVEGRTVSASDYDAAYAVARLTPGTNLLALYALLGHRLGGWRLALQAVAVGAVLPAAVVVMAAIAYTHGASSPLVSSAMRGARAGGLAVFLGAVIRLIRPQLADHRRFGLAFAVAAFAVVWFLPANQLIVLLLAGAAGAAVLKPRR